MQLIHSTDIKLYYSSHRQIWVNELTCFDPRLTIYMVMSAFKQLSSIAKHIDGTGDQTAYRYTLNSSKANSSSYMHNAHWEVHLPMNGQNSTNWLSGIRVWGALSKWGTCRIFLKMRFLHHILQFEIKFLTMQKILRYLQ